MKVVVATDSFKGCLSSLDAGLAIKRGILKVSSDAKVDVFPISDGGEGLSQALEKHFETEKKEIIVTGPDFIKVRAMYGLNLEKGLAVIEMASAAGLPLVKGEKDPKSATTYGVGELINDAIDQGARKFIIGIGGSATNDGGMGMLSALGFGFLDQDGNKVPPTPLGLKDLVSIDLSHVRKELNECSFTVACDVDIPLCGANGCSRIFGPQKGANPKDIEDMDSWLLKYAEMTKEIYPEADKDVPGSGAAGGMGFALRSYLGALLKPGIDIAITETGLEEKIAQADFVVTGEGRIDGQTVMGKVVSGVAKVAKRYGKPVAAVCGSVSQDAILQDVDIILPITPGPMTLEEAMKPDVALGNLERTAKQAFELINIGRKAVP